MTLNTPRVAVVTGASSGIGKEAAKALAAQDWHVIAHGRDPERTAAARREILKVAPNARVDMVRGDLCLLSDTARMANEILALTDRVDCLLNNAGGVREHLVITPEGNEATFAGNHLGHYLLTGRLLPALCKAAAAQTPRSVRIVNVSSRGHQGCQAIDWDDLQQTTDWTSIKSYSQAKLCNILFARELASRLGQFEIVAHAMHPGVVATNFAEHGGPAFKQHMAAVDTISPEEGADTLVWLATAEEPGETTGGYYFQRQAVDPSPAALDADAARTAVDRKRSTGSESGPGTCIC